MISAVDRAKLGPRSMLVPIHDFRLEDQRSVAQGAEYARQLEEGHILFFPRTPIVLSADERELLLGGSLTVAPAHKNIAYSPQTDRVTGLSKRCASENKTVRAVLRRYASQATELVSTLLPAYSPGLRVDYTSFRPEEEEGRALRQRSRNDLLHTDAFPSRPMNGDRILRVFTNINPDRPRRWVTTDTFGVLIKRFAGASALRLPSPLPSPWWRQPFVRRSPYDAFMLRFHNFLKSNREFQATCPKQTWDFPPDSTWIVFTDAVPHAALSGQYALEQTFSVSREAMIVPEVAPINILESLCGGPLVLDERRVAR